MAPISNQWVITEGCREGSSISHIEVPRLRQDDRLSNRSGESSAAVRARVAAASQIQQARFAITNQHCHQLMSWPSSPPQRRIDHIDIKRFRVKFAAHERNLVQT